MSLFAIVTTFLAAVAAATAWITLRWYLGAQPQGSPEETERTATYRRWIRASERVFLLLLLALLAAGAWVGWYYRDTRTVSAPQPVLVRSPSASDEADLRRVVREIADVRVHDAFPKSGESEN